MKKKKREGESSIKNKPRHGDPSAKRKHRKSIIKVS